MVDGVMRLIEAATNEPVNIGNPKEMSIEAIAGEIIAATGSTSKLVRQPLPIDDPKMRQPDITKARELLGWKPKVSLKDGLAETIAYFRDKLAKPGC